MPKDMLTSFRVIFIRHAKAGHNLYNGRDTFAGQRVDSKLTNAGKKEAEGLARKIYGQGILEIIFYSKMRRSRDTAEIIAKSASATGTKKPRLIRLDGLEEIDAGDFTNLTKEETEQKDRAAAEAFYNNDIVNWDFPGGENYLMLKERVKQVVEKINAYGKPGVTILVVGHGAFNRVIFHEIIHEKKELWQTLNYPHDLLVTIKGPSMLSGEK